MMQDISPFGLRLPADLRAELEAAAKRNERSLNSELIFRLRESLRLERRTLLDYSDAELLEELLARYDRDQMYIRLGAKPADD